MASSSMKKPTPSKLKNTRKSKKDQGISKARKNQLRKFDDDESLLDSDLDFSPFEDEEIPKPEDVHPPPRRRRRSRTRSHRSQPRRQRSRSRRSASGRRRSGQRRSKKSS